MSDKKHIDRLFQEKLKDFEVAPNSSAWDNIHSQLHKEGERNRKIIPLWWKLAGVAAVLVLLLTVGIKLTSRDGDLNKTIVDTEKQSPDSSNDESKSNGNKIIKSNNGSADFEAQTDNASNVANEDSSETSNGVSNETVKSGSEKNKSNTNRLNTTETNKTRLVNNSDGNRTNLYRNPSQDNNVVNKKDVIADASKTDQNNSKKNEDAQTKEIYELNKLIKDSKSDNNSAVTKASDKMEDILEEDKTAEDNTQNSIENAMAAVITDEEEKDEKEKRLNRWNISPNVAPVYFNSLGKGSPIDEQFVNNNKEGEVTVSYGVGGSYAINNRLKVRTGINKVDLGYSTDNVIAFRSIDQTARDSGLMDNISVNVNAQNMTYLSSETLNRNTTPEIINTKSQGAINQRFGFIEVPLELEYAVIDNKFGINVIGGFSTLFVDNNEIFSVIDGNQTLIGEANNINDLSYSANFGLGINYNISEKIKVNVEPTFKYQINTFSNSSGDFKPFFIGVYTGLSYKF